MSKKKIRGIGRYGEMDPFDFNDNNQQDVESSSNEFLDLAENNKTKDYRTLIFDHILDCQRDRYPLY